MNLYEVSNEIGRLFAEYEETGNEEILLEIEKLDSTRDVKIDSLAKLYKNNNALSDALKAESEALLKRKKSIDSNCDWIKEYLSGCLVNSPFENERHKITFRKSEKTIVLDEMLLPDSALVIVPETKKPDLKTVKAMIQSGVIGAEVAKIETCQNIQIK
jgi:hypothetical protein